MGTGQYRAGLKVKYKLLAYSWHYGSYVFLFSNFQMSHNTVMIILISKSPIKK